MLIAAALFGIAITLYLFWSSRNQRWAASDIQPDHYVVEGFPERIMPLNYGSDLTDEEITHLVSYLMTLEEENKGER